MSIRVLTNPLPATTLQLGTHTVYNEVIQYTTYVCTHFIAVNVVCTVYVITGIQHVLILCDFSFYEHCGIKILP